jgi:hypothetical protein
MEDVTLSWPGSMTTEQAKKYLLTAGFVPVELYRQQIAQSDTRRKSIMDKKQQTTSAGPDFVTKLPQVDERGDETPMQSDQIVTLARAVRLLAFHVERVKDEWQCREGLRGIRDDMEDLIYTITGRR